MNINESNAGKYLPMHYANNKERIPLEHYSNLYQTLVPDEVSARCGIPFDESIGTFRLHMMGEPLRIEHPVFVIRKISGEEISNASTGILLLRFLIHGRHFEPTGHDLTYRDVPGGNLYYPNFAGRCLKRLAFTVGRDLDRFAAYMQHIGGEKLNTGDCAYRFEFMSNLFMTFILWAGDDEFPPSAQILFDNNFPFAFSVEDMAVACDLAISSVKENMSK